MTGSLGLVVPGISQESDADGFSACAQGRGRAVPGRDRMAVDVPAAKCKKAARPTGRGE